MRVIFVANLMGKPSDEPNYAIHVNKENHLFNENLKILHITTKGSSLNFLEILEGKNSDDLLNKHTDFNISPLLNLFDYYYVQVTISRNLIHPFSLVNFNKYTDSEECYPFQCWYCFWYVQMHTIIYVRKSIA